MSQPNDERCRALRTLSRSPNGCTLAVLMAHGFPMEMIEQLVSSGHAKADAYKMTVAGRTATVVWLKITATGRKAIG
jgi:hypothetical protein